MADISHIVMDSNMTTLHTAEIMLVGSRLLYNNVDQSEIQLNAGFVIGYQCCLAPSSFLVRSLHVVPAGVSWLAPAVLDTCSVNWQFKTGHGCKVDKALYESEKHMACSLKSLSGE